MSFGSLQGFLEVFSVFPVLVFMACLSGVILINAEVLTNFVSYVSMLFIHY